MFGSYKDYLPPKVDNPYFTGGTFGAYPSPQMSFGQPGGNQNLFTIPPLQPPSVNEQKSVLHEQAAPSPIHIDNSPHGKENSFSRHEHILTESDQLNKPKPGRLMRQKPVQQPIVQGVRLDEPAQSSAPLSQAHEYGKTISDLTTALTHAVMEKSALMTENKTLKDRVSAYEERLSQVDSMFTTMMARISALEQQAPSATLLASRVTARRVQDNSPKSPAISARSTRTVNVSVAPKPRSMSTVKTRPQPPQPAQSAARARSNSATPSSRAVAVAARGRVGSASSIGPVLRSKSPAKITASPVVSARPTSPLIRYEVHIAFNDRVVAKAQLAPMLSQDGPFLYVIQSELKPPMNFIPPSNGVSPCAFTGLSISVVGTNTRSRKSNIVFKSHSSHVDNPPVNDSDGYFSHSCWLSGPGASVVGGVRVFYRPVEGEEGGLTLYAMSLKFWFPENSDSGMVGSQAPNFTKEHWKELLRLLGLL